MDSKAKPRIQIQFSHLGASKLYNNLLYQLFKGTDNVYINNRSTKNDDQTVKADYQED